MDFVTLRGICPQQAVSQPFEKRARGNDQTLPPPSILIRLGFIFTVPSKKNSHYPLISPPSSLVLLLSLLLSCCCLALSPSNTVSTGTHVSPLYLHLLHQGLWGSTNACKWRWPWESAGLNPNLNDPAGYMPSNVARAREYMSSRSSRERSWSSRPWTCCRGTTRRCIIALGFLSFMIKHWSVATRTSLDFSLIAQKGHCRKRKMGVRGRRSVGFRWELESVFAGNCWETEILIFERFATSITHDICPISTTAAAHS